MSHLLSAIQHVLWREWDPIGVRDLGGPDDEYDSYASEIYAMFQSSTKSTVLEITIYLDRVETENMGLSFASPDNEMIARRIMGLRT